MISLWLRPHSVQVCFVSPLTNILSFEFLLFAVPLQMADNIDSLSGDLVESKKAILAQRRCIILAIVGATPSSNTTLASVLENGFLSTVKSWLDDILGGSVGELVFSFLRLAVVIGLSEPLIVSILIFSQFPAASTK
jgi:hypothetical protein